MTNIILALTVKVSVIFKLADGVAVWGSQVASAQTERQTESTLLENTISDMTSYDIDTILWIQAWYKAQ